MAETAKRKGGGAKTSRSEAVTVRLDPKLRYLAEVAARVQRRTLSSYIEHALADSLKRVDMNRKDGQPETVDQAGNVLWNIDEIERLGLLQQSYPELLSYEEQQLFKLAIEASVLGGIHDHTSLRGNHARYLRSRWEMLKQAAADGLVIDDILDKLAPPDTVQNVTARIQQWEEHLATDKAKLKALGGTTAAVTKKAK
jgi:hypothetical protein